MKFSVRSTCFTVLCLVSGSVCYAGQSTVPQLPGNEAEAPEIRTIGRVQELSYEITVAKGAKLYAQATYQVLAGETLRVSNSAQYPFYAVVITPNASNPDAAQVDVLIADKDKTDAKVSTRINLAQGDSKTVKAGEYVVWILRRDTAASAK